VVGRRRTTIQKGHAMPVVRNAVETYEGDQIVVEHGYVGFVQEQLRRLGIAARELDANIALRLSLVGLENLDTSAAALRQDAALMADLTADRASHGHPAAGEAEALDVAVFALRRQVRGEHDGWVPTIGKNRLLDRIEAAPYIKGSIGDPRSVAPISFPAAARRPGGRVAILDTELYAHPALAGRCLGDVVTDLGPAPRSTQAHATFIAGLVAQRAPTAELVARTVLDNDGLNVSSWAVANAIVDVLDFDIAVLNLSLCCATADRVPPLCLSRAIERALPSVVVVAAAGNVGEGGPATTDFLTRGTPQYPAAIDGVVAVGAYDSRDPDRRPAPFTPDAPWIDLLAPGVDEQSTFLPGAVSLMQWVDGALVIHDTATFDGYARWSGTSFAAANVSGAVAALVEPGHRNAYDALDLLREKGVPGGDIVEFG
jgi:subtilisin family serine protease